MAQAHLRSLLFAATATLAAGIACSHNTDTGCVTTEGSAILGGSTTTDLGANAYRATVFLSLYGAGEANPELGWCSGVRIDERRILTAAHCLPESEAARFEVSFPPGVEVKQDDCGLSDTIFPAQLGPIHPSLDAMIVKLTDIPSNPGPTLELAALPSAGSPSIAAGYGIGDNFGPGHLLFLSTRITSSGDGWIQTEAGEDRGTCVGDSGGPLFVRSADGEDRLAGILTSGSALCGGVDDYIPVAALEAWLNSEAP